MLQFKVNTVSGVAELKEDNRQIAVIAFSYSEKTPTIASIVQVLRSLAWSLGYKVCETENAQIEAR